MNAKIVIVILLSLLRICFAEKQKNICGIEDYFPYGIEVMGEIYTPQEVENCQDCVEGLCKQEDLISASSKTANVCYWNDYRDICLPNKGWFISGKCKIILLSFLRPGSVLWLGQIVLRLRWLWDQGGVWRGVLLAGQTRVLCSHHRSGLCSILLLAFACLLVNSASPFLSLTSTGLAAERFPGAMTVYALSQTTRISHQLVGYSRLPHQTDRPDQEDFYIFKDYSQQSTEFVSRVPFSIDENSIDGKGLCKM